jgi:hypothetical protein
MAKKKHVPLPKKRKVVSDEHAGPATDQPANQDVPEPPVQAHVPAAVAPTDNRYPKSGETTTTGPPNQVAYHGDLLQPVITAEAPEDVEPLMVEPTGPAAQVDPVLPPVVQMAPPDNEGSDDEDA